MFTFLIHEAADQDTGQDTLFGGRPLIPSDSITTFRWPVCRSCHGPMQFLGRLMVPEDQNVPRHRILLFQCNNCPGMCDEWEADKGGNYALVVPEGPVEAVPVPDHPEVLRSTLYAATTVAVPLAQPGGYYETIMAWAATTGQPERHVLGYILGTPQWIQTDETPCCNACAIPMKFVARLEQGPHDDGTDINFGGGSGYVFECRCGVAKFLWQC